MANNTINFSNLKRKEVRKTIITNDSENPIIIYNPNVENQKKIKKLMINNTSDNGEVTISGEDILLKVLPLVTNIILDLNEETDKDLINEILNDPSDEFLSVIEEVHEIIKEISVHFQKDISIIANLSPEKLNQIFEENKNLQTLTEEEIAIIEKAKKLGKI